MSHRVTIEPIGETITVEDGQTLLDAALRHGIFLPHACGHGLCATCKVQVLAGDVDHGEASPFALMDTERDDGRTLACCARALSDVTIEADVDEDPDALHIALRDWDATVTELVDLTPTIKGVFVELDDPQGLDFQAGQYVNLWLPGFEHPRAFSLSNDPAWRNRLEFNVRRVPGGAGTGHVHDTLRIGDRVRLTAPLGRFFVRKSDPQPMLFMAGGSGLSSPRSMIVDLLENDHDPRPITLVYGARSRDELYYHDEFLDLAERFPNFRYVPALSAPAGDDAWDGETGFVHDVATRTFGGDFRGHKAYLCGPPVMIEACIRALMQGRLFEKDIHTERFVTAADGAGALARSPVFRNI